MKHAQMRAESREQPEGGSSVVHRDGEKVRPYDSTQVLCTRRENALLLHYIYICIYVYYALCKNPS